jgi:ferredoxin-NADP reductase
MINLDYSEHPVREVRFVNDGLFELLLDRNGLDFAPGDCAAIYTADEKSRPYSIASGPNEDDLRFVIRAVDDGEVSPWLAARQPGDTIRITPPFGWFRPGRGIGDAPFVFIATGTGIAPFLSYINTFDRPPEACLYGVRREADAIGFPKLAGSCPTTLAVSREPTQHHHGRLTGLLGSLPLNEQTHCYCCGLESMVNEVSSWLLDHGIAPGRIHREVFFHG